MIVRLTREQSDALRTAGHSGLEVLDPSTNRVYVVVDGETHRRAMEALQQQDDDWASIQAGIAQADAGETMSLEETDRQLREEFGFTPRS